MKRKPVPPAPESLDSLAAHRRALPLVPGSEDDCCARLMERAGAPDRSTAGEWLEFLCAIGLARETETGFVKTRNDLDTAALASNFLDGIVLTDDIVTTLDDTPQTAESVYESVADGVPRWERQKRDDWQDVWRDHVERRLDWAVLLDLAEETPDGYTTT